MSCTHVPHRKPRTTLKPIGQAVIGEPLEELLADICRRIRGVRHRTQAGTYVLADAQGNVCVLQEIQPQNAALAQRAAAGLVGLYAGEARGPVFPDVERMRIDLIAALVRVGFISQDTLRGQIAHSDP